jgi:hypothetical protein
VGRHNPERMHTPQGTSLCKQFARRRFAPRCESVPACKRASDAWATGHAGTPSSEVQGGVNSGDGATWLGWGRSRRVVLLAVVFFMQAAVERAAMAIPFGRPHSLPSACLAAAPHPASRARCTARAARARGRRRREGSLSSITSALLPLSYRSRAARGRRRRAHATAGPPRASSPSTHTIGLGSCV